MASVHDHPANEDEADRHLRSPRVPTAIAIAVAVLSIVAVAYLRGAFR